MSKALDLSLALPSGSLEAYIQAAGKIPVLSADEERQLAKRYRDHDDLGAARQLVLSHLRFVVHIARGYNGYGLPQGDLIQEGNIGLMKAVKRFDPDVGVRLVSFAVHWIRAEIHEYILRNWRIVKVATTKAQRKLFFNLRNAKKHLGWLRADEVQHMAKELNVSPETVLEMEARMSGGDTPYDPYTEMEDETPSPANYLPDHRYEPAQLAENSQLDHDRESMLNQAMETLDERSRAIVTQRWLTESKATLHELADQYGVSAERIRQLEQSAMKKLKNFLGHTLPPAASEDRLAA